MQSNDTTQSSKDNEKAKNTDQEEKLLTLPARETYLETLESNGMVINVLIDTGFNECLIRKDLVTDISEMKPSPLKTAHLFDGSKVDLLGYIYQRITREGKTVEMTLYVVAELSYPMILGANWMLMISENPTPKIIAEVGDIGPIVSLVDSGCNTCLVRRDVLIDSIKSKITPETGTATLYDGSKVESLGYIRLPVTYLGKTVELDFYVHAELSHPMILGTTWIRRSSAILKSDGTKLGVTFGGKEENPDCSTETCCSLPYVSVDVDGIVNVSSALVDTGASKSSIKRDILKEDQKLKVVPTSESSIIGSGTKITTLEMVSLNITVQEKTTCIENVAIPSKMGEKLILGMDWIHQTRAVIQSDGSKIIVSLPDLPQKKKRSNEEAIESEKKPKKQ